MVASSLKDAAVNGNNSVPVKAASKTVVVVGGAAVVALSRFALAVVGAICLADAVAGWAVVAVFPYFAASAIGAIPAVTGCVVVYAAVVTLSGFALVVVEGCVVLDEPMCVS